MRYSNCALCTDYFSLLNQFLSYKEQHKIHFKCCFNVVFYSTWFSAVVTGIPTNLKT